MFKEYLVLSSRDPRRNLECQDYVINRHARAVLRHHAFQGVFRRYIISRTVQPGTASMQHTLYAQRTEVPMIVEHVCDDAALFRKALQNEDHKAAIKPDEEYIASEFLSGPPMAIEMDERLVLSQPHVSRYRVFDFLVRRPEVDRSEFVTWLDREAELLADSNEFRSIASRRVHNVAGSGAALYAESGGTGASTGQGYGAIVETWVDSLQDFSTVLPSMMHRYDNYVDSAASYSVVTTEHVLVTDQS